MAVIPSASASAAERLASSTFTASARFSAASRSAVAAAVTEDCLLFRLSRRVDQLDRFAAFGDGHFACGVHQFFGFHRIGARGVGGGVCLRLLLRLLGDGDRGGLVGEFDGLALLSLLDLGFAVGFDLLFLRRKGFCRSRRC